MEFFYNAHQPKKKEKSFGRLITQQRMQLGMAFLHPLRPIINETWLSQGNGNKSKAFGQALKQVFREAIEGQYPEQYLVPERVLISVGLLPGVEVEDVVLAGNEVEVYFSSLENPMTSTADEVVLLAYSPEAGVGGRNDVPCYRKDGLLRMELPVHFQNQAFHLYLYVRGANGKQYSKSAYLGYFGEMQK